MSHGPLSNDDDDEPRAPTDPINGDSSDDGDDTEPAVIFSPSHQQSQQQQQLSDIMESVVKITGAGLGGTIVGLSLQHRLQDLRVTTPAAIAAEARRKRFRGASVATSSQGSPSVASLATRNLPLTWALACTTFVSIIEISRFLSPSTILMQIFVGKASDDGTDTSSEKTSISSSPISRSVSTVADYTFGGAVAGVASAIGQRQSRLTTPTMHQNAIRRAATTAGRPPMIGVLSGIGLGLVAGCLQAAVDYGVALAEKQRLDMKG